MVSSTPRPHFTPGKDPVPIVQEAARAPGPVWTGGKFRPHRDSIPDLPARSQSLYRLSYPAHILLINTLYYSQYNVLFTPKYKQKVPPHLTVNIVLFGAIVCACRNRKAKCWLNVKYLTAQQVSGSAAVVGFFLSLSFVLFCQSYSTTEWERSVTLKTKDTTHYVHSNFIDSAILD